MLTPLAWCVSLCGKRALRPRSDLRLFGQRFLRPSSLEQELQGVVVVVGCIQLPLQDPHPVKNNRRGRRSNKS